MVLQAICPFTGFGGLLKDREWRMQKWFIIVPIVHSDPTLYW